MHLREFGKIIKERRNVLRLTQKSLSDLSEVGLKTVIMMEKGEANPSAKTLNQVLDVLGLELCIKVKEIS